MNNVERNNDPTDILRSSGQYKYHQLQYILRKVINKNIDKTLYATIDIIKKVQLESLDYRLYIAACTIKKYVGELKITAPTQNKKKKMPNWIKIIENSIENTRKFIGKLATVIACKKSNTYYLGH